MQSHCLPSACIPLQACLQSGANVRRGLALSMHVHFDGNVEHTAHHAPTSAACLQVYSNEAVWEEGALRVRPFYRAGIPHGCPDCPPNLCKGQASFSGLQLLSCWPELSKLQRGLTSSRSSRKTLIGDARSMCLGHCPALTISHIARGALTIKALKDSWTRRGKQCLKCAHTSGAGFTACQQKLPTRCLSGRWRWRLLPQQTTQVVRLCPCPRVLSHR